jgi:hypothetical protein
MARDLADYSAVAIGADVTGAATEGFTAGIRTG